jgi:hypothetical protein
MIKKTFFSLLLVASGLIASAEELHISAQTGNDANPGTQTQPLKTIAEAARRVNANYKKEGATLVLAAGAYQLTETVLFNNNKFTIDNRLVIRAEIMPDDAGWSPQHMPIILMPLTRPDNDGEIAKGLEINVNHATVEGLRFAGSPVYYYVDGKKNRKPYPLCRFGKNLDDLLVTQCVFAGNHDVMPIRVGVIAQGHGLVLDHCVFFNCENSVVFWDGEAGTSLHDAMRYCIVYHSNYSGVWTTGDTGEDFEFQHNIIADSKTAWMNDKSGRYYSAHDCIFTGNQALSAFGFDPGAANNNAQPDYNFLKTERVQLKGSIEIEMDQSKNNYMQLKTASFGTELKAGLFKR